MPTGRLGELRTRKDRPETPFELYDNPSVSPQYHDACPRPADLGEAQVRRAAGLEIAGVGHGNGVVLAIVDRGIDMGAIMSLFPGITRNEAFSWPKVPSPIYGDHGTLCAYVAAVAAPEAGLADVRVAGDTRGFMEAYDHLRKTWVADKRAARALVVSTSWEFPAPEPVFDAGETLARSARHPLASTLRCLGEAGADIVFAAGNGGVCSAASGRGTITPPATMPDVFTIAAVDGAKVRLADSGQGGSGAATKPDISAFGSLILQDGTTAGHTSVATAFAAGMTASLRSLDGWAATERSSALVRRCFTMHADKDVRVVSAAGTVAPTTLTAHSPDFGFGVMRFDADVGSWKDSCGSGK